MLQVAIGSDSVRPETDEVSHLLEVRADLLKALDLYTRYEEKVLTLSFLLNFFSKGM